jgi:hypothetical protein
MKNMIIKVKITLLRQSLEGITKHLFWLVLDLHSGHSADWGRYVRKEYDE